MNKKEAGDKGEKAAKDYYTGQGYTVVATNYRFKRSGEIDLICTKGEIVVFCEVKYRSDPRVYSPAEAVTPTKIRKIRTVAGAFLLMNPKYQNFDVRFDIAEVTRAESGLKVNLLENAF